MSLNANITGSCNVSDNFDFSDWQNTSTVLVGDIITTGLS